MNEIGITIGEKHTFRDWGLMWATVSIPMPNARTKTVEVPGMNGVLDLTEAINGEVCYANRSLTFTFTADCTAEAWHALYSQIASYCHGRRLKVVLDTDPSYYYEGRIAVQSTRDNNVYGDLTITVDADPFKQEMESAAEEWLWDPFSFESGIIRGYKDLTSPCTLTVIGTVAPVVPVITCSTALSLEFGGNTYALKQGENENPDIVIRSGENEMVFTGSGTFTIDFRGCSL